MQIFMSEFFGTAGYGEPDYEESQGRSTYGRSSGRSSRRSRGTTQRDEMSDDAERYGE